MPEIPLPEDEAARYVLGEMDLAERHRFEERLEKSEELRMLVRELQAGTVAAALALPQREPPGQLWQKIEESMAAEVNREQAPAGFWRALRAQGGWWAAAACLIGWLLYAFWINLSETPVSADKSATVLPENKSVEPAPGENLRVEGPRALSSSPTLTNAIGLRPPLSALARTGEIAALRRQVQDLETQVSHLSLVLTQQQVLPSEATQFTFLQLVPSSSGGSPGRVGSPSPELQRAMFLAMARELGWLRAKAEPGHQETKDEDSDPTAADPLVEFVQLTPVGGDSQAQTSEPPDSGGVTNLAQTSTTTSDETAIAGVIPAFASGGYVFLGVDGSIVPVGSALSFWNGTQLMGTAVLGSSPMVVSFQSPNPSGNLGVTSVAGGTTNTSVFLPPGPAPH